MTTVDRLGVTKWNMKGAGEDGEDDGWGYGMEHGGSGRGR